MQRIVLFLPNWIGDVVMATPAIRAVREHFPAARLLAVARPYVADLLSGSPWFDDVILYDRRGPKEHRGWSIIRRLRSEHLDAAVLFPNSFRAALLAYWGNCKQRIGFARYGRNLLLSKRFYPTRDRQGGYLPVPMLADYNRLVLPLGVPAPSLRMELFTTDDDERAADRIWNDFRLGNSSEVICLNSGGAFGAAKHWPIESFARLAQQIVDQRDASVLVLCGPNERELARSIVRQADRSRVFSLADTEVSLGLTKACVRRCDLLVTTDSGPRHFAAAFDRPVVSLFGPTHIGWTETWFAKAIHLQKKVPCGPCQLRVCPLDHRCMRDLTVAEVYAAANELLRLYPADRRLCHAG